VRRAWLVILDSCATPFAAKMARTKLTRSVDRGLARVEPTANVLVAYAAKDGTTATMASRNVPTRPRCSNIWAHAALKSALCVSQGARRRDGGDQPAPAGPSCMARSPARPIYLARRIPPQAARLRRNRAFAQLAAAQAAAAGALAQHRCGGVESISQSTDAGLFENSSSGSRKARAAGEAQTRLAALRAGGESTRSAIRMARRTGGHGR